LVIVAHGKHSGRVGVNSPVNLEAATTLGVQANPLSLGDGMIE